MTKIVCIEDEADFREDLVETLEDLGYQVVQAANGQDGLEAILEHRPALVICDRMMPQMSGTDLLQTIRDRHPDLSSTPFIFLTALGDRRDMHATAELSPTAYLTKPVDFDRLESLIEEFVGGKAADHVTPKDAGS